MWKKKGKNLTSIISQLKHNTANKNIKIKFPNENKIQEDFL